MRANRYCPVSKMKILWVLLSQIIFLHTMHTSKFQSTNFLQFKTRKTLILQNELHWLNNITALCAISISICPLEQQYSLQLLQTIQIFLFLHDGRCHSRSTWHWYPCTLYYMITQACTVPNTSSKVHRLTLYHKITQYHQCIITAVEGWWRNVSCTKHTYSIHINVFPNHICGWTFCKHLPNIADFWRGFVMFQVKRATKYFLRWQSIFCTTMF